MSSVLVAARCSSSFRFVSMSLPVVNPENQKGRRDFPGGLRVELDM